MVRYLFIVSLFFSITASALPPAAQSPHIDHVIMIVFDQMRPDYIDRFDLPHFKKFRKMATHYRNAYVGHMGAETVVSHMVLSTGKLPKDLPWQDEIFFDKKGLLGKPGAFHFMGGLGFEKTLKLLSLVPKKELLPAVLKEKFGGLVVAIGEKNYAATTFGTPAADSVITLKKTGDRCSPDGIRVPSYISYNDRFTLECSKKYGTEKNFVPLDGSRLVPGDDPSHLGGDVWVTDVAKEVMDHENWSALFLTYGGIDWIGHLTGEQDGVHPFDIHSDYHLSDVLKIADAQLGTLMDELQKKNLLSRTMIVVTADHGAQFDKFYFGKGWSAKSGMHGILEKNFFTEPSFWENHLLKSGKVAFSYQDTAIRTWLSDYTEENRKAVVEAMSMISGVAEIYSLSQANGQWQYKQVYEALEKQPRAFQHWARIHNLELVNSMASENAPDLIGLLADGVGFGMIGDHGGAQENVQRIPLMLMIPGVKPQVIEKPMRLADVKSMVLKAVH